MSKVYVCTDTGDGDILGVYQNKADADECRVSFSRIIPSTKTGE